MQTVDKIINAKWVLPIAPQNNILENHSVIIQNGRILDVLPTEKAGSQYQANETVTLSDHAVMPGLVNAHTHSPMVLFRGLADDLNLMDWLNNHIWPAEANVINAQSNADGMRLAVAEMIRGGTTCFNEMYFFPNESAAVVIEEGMRALIGHTIMNVPTGWAQDENEYIEKARVAHNERQQHDLINFTISPQGPYTNSDRSLTLAKELATELNLRMNIHLHETKDELQIDLGNHGKHPIQRLDGLGLLDNKLTAIHMVHLTDDNIALISERGVHSVHCPESNLKLASGFSPVIKMQKAGINVALGTDGAASNNDLDMFGEIRSAAFIAKVVNEDPTAMAAPQALELATINGAKALGLENEIGSLEKGKAADIIAIDLSSYLTQPVYNPISQIVYAANRLQVSDVWVAGKQLLKTGDFTQLDIERTLANAKPWAKQAAQFKSKACEVALV